MRIELDISGVELEAWANRQELRHHSGIKRLTEAEDDLRRAVAMAAERMLHSMGFEDATVKWWDQ